MSLCDWSSDVCSSDLPAGPEPMTATLFPVRTAGGRGATQPSSKARSTIDSSIALIVTGSSLISRDRKSTRLNSSHTVISYAVFGLKKKKLKKKQHSNH